MRQQDGPVGTAWATALATAEAAEMLPMKLYEDLTRTPLRIAQQDRGSKDP